MGQGRFLNQKLGKRLSHRASLNKAHLTPPQTSFNLQKTQSSKLKSSTTSKFNK